MGSGSSIRTQEAVAGRRTSFSPLEGNDMLKRKDDKETASMTQVRARGTALLADRCSHGQGCVYE